MAMTPHRIVVVTVDCHLLNRLSAGIQETQSHITITESQARDVSLRLFSALLEVMRLIVLQ